MKVNREQLEIDLARAKMDRKKLAESAGLPLSQVNDVFTRRSATPETVGRLADALNVDVLELVIV